MKDQKTVEEVMGSIAEKQRLSEEELRKLEMSRALESIWPGVFDHGYAKSYWYGTVNDMEHNYSPSVPKNYHAKFVVTNGRGEERRFTYREVPEVLGGGLRQKNPEG